MQLRVVTAAATDNRTGGAVQQGQLGGGVARPLAPPFDVQLLAVDRLTGQAVGLPPNVAGSTIELRLPVPVAALGPDEEVAWLMEVDDSRGLFLGYSRPPARFDPATSQLVLVVLASQLQGTLFLPVVLTDAYVRNFSPGVHMWSSPFADAVDFGVAAPQWTRMQVIAPQLGHRLPVVNAFTARMGWIDVDGVGPVSVGDGLPPVPVMVPSVAPVNSTGPRSPSSTDSIPPPPVIGESATYTVQSGDTLKSIAHNRGDTLQVVLAANLGLDADHLQIGQLLQVPVHVP